MKKTFEELLIEHCSTTLVGVKTGNIFCYGERQKDICYEVGYWNDRLSPLGVNIRIVKHCGNKGNCLIYVYRPKRLIKDLKQEGVIGYLSSIGYNDDLKISSLLDTLSLRLMDCKSFPHEIGLFLGYPLHDVIGFIQNQGRNFYCCGYWKVYKNPQQAKKWFEQYKKCTEIYRKMYQKGKSIIQLTVAA